jgi:large subunit ribosomal protein L9
MEIILTEKIEKLGEIGDLVNVKNGYARNFLLPNDKALRATPENKKLFEEQKKAIIAKNEQIKKEAKITFDKINKKEVLIIVQASDEGRLFGSVMPKDIAQKIIDILKVDVKKSQIVITNTIRNIGLYNIKARVHADYIADIILNIARSEAEGKENHKKAAINNEAVALATEVTNSTSKEKPSL